MRINTNVASLTALEANANTNKNLGNSLEKLSTGLRINKAADDASGMSIADKLRTQASSIAQGIQNANSGNALLQIADKAMSEQSNILDIVKTKLIQASTMTTSVEGREAIRKDIGKLLEQLDNISAQTNYNGINLLDVKGKDFSFQVGENAVDSIGTKTAYAANTSGLGGGSTEYTTQAPAFENLGDSMSLKNDGGDLANTITMLTLGSGTVTYEIEGVEVSYTTSITDEDHVQADGLAAAIQAKIDDGSIVGVTVEAVDKDVIIRSVNNGELVTITDKDATTSLASMTTVEAGVAVNTATTTTIGGGLEASFSVGGSNITKMTVSATAGTSAITMTTTDADVIAKFDTIIAAGRDTLGNGDGVIVKTSEGVYTLTASAANADTAIDFGAGIDMGEISFTNVHVGTIAGATETVVFESVYPVTITSDSNVDFEAQSANGTDFTSATAKDNLIGGNSLGGLKSLAEDSLTVDVANMYMETVDQALTQLNILRSDFGSTQNQLESFTRNAMTTQTNIKAAESVIRDVDYASESANFNKMNIIAQAGTYAISQANNVQQNVMKLLQ